MLSAAKHLAAAHDRPFAEFTLSEAHVLRVTRCDCSNGQGLFFTIEPCLNLIIGSYTTLAYARLPTAFHIPFGFLNRKRLRDGHRDTVQHSITR